MPIHNSSYLVEKDDHVMLGTTLLTSHKRITQNIAMQSDIFHM